MRSKGIPYSRIAEQLWLSEGTIRSYCSRKQIAGVALQKCVVESIPPGVCAQCGTAIEQIPKRKPRRYCSAACRRAWWKEHGAQAGHGAAATKTCPVCGTAFTRHPSQKRTRCSMECYVRARFGGAEHA